MKYVTEHASNSHKDSLQKKLVRGVQKAPHSRALPPSLLEWRSNRQRTNMALPLTLPDGSVSTVCVDSWSTCEEAAALAVTALGVDPEGWSVILDDAGVVTDNSGLDYVFDLVSELELCPAFPATKSQLLKVGVRHSSPVENDHHTTTITRPQVPPPEPPKLLSRKISGEHSRQSSPQLLQPSSRKSSRDTREYSPQPQRDSPRTSTPNRKTSHEALSRSSALNERYFDIEKVRSRSLDNLLSEPEPTPLSDLGLSQSRLNDRYHSVEQLAPIKPIIAATPNYMSKQEMEFEYPDVSSVSTSNRGGPRYIKSQYVGKKAPPGSHSSRAHIEKSEFVVRSSAMSDTSEAPSLASHVRRVRVPSQASDVDQFLDELFSPVLDGNLDELSDARSLAASIKGGGLNSVNNMQEFDKFLDDCLDIDSDLGLSNADIIVNIIKGGGHRDRSSSHGSTALDKEVETLTSNKGKDNTNGNVDDYISDLFKPIFINDSLKALTEKENLVDSIKGGGTTHQQNGASTSGYGYPAIQSPLVSPQPLMLPLIGGQEGFMPMYNMQGVGIPQNADIAAYQQNLQRAFLQSAMAQNIQIQQQLLAQNQALQQLLTQSSDVKVESSLQTTVRAQIHQDANNSSTTVTTSINKAVHKGNNRKISSPNTSSSIDYSRKVSTESNMSVVSRNGAAPPPPPPMPPPIDECDPSETRPFMDPYGRAKTVRIGKWRWPPPKGENSAENGEDFMHFKMRQHQRKVTPIKENNPPITNGHSTNNNGMQINSQSSEWEEMQFESVVQENEKLKKVTTRRSFEVGASRPAPGSIGKLKLSSEMRQRLEQVTSNHSVRSTSSKVERPSRSVNKLEDTRKMMLEQQLKGRWGDDDTSNVASGPPSPVTPTKVRAQQQKESKSPTQQSWASSNWKPGPPPPPIGPSSLPPAPAGPAPPPPIRPQQPPPPIEPPRESFMAQRQDRDTFGVHQNRTMQNNSKRNSFSANWEVQSSITQETQDDGVSWGKDALDVDKHDGRISRDSSWDIAESTVTSVEPIRKNPLMNDRWDMERKYDRREKHAQEPSERPTFRTHQFSKIAKEREKKHSVSTVNTERNDNSKLLI